MTRAFFHNCENPRTGQDAPTNALDQGCVASTVVATPIRGPERHLDYGEQLRHLHKMCTAISNFADFFQNLHLHRIPFLTVDVLALLVPTLRNLKVLGIYKCQLIHIGNTLRLLSIIKMDKPLERENQISLDFFPNYHVGPMHRPGENNNVASYGVTWDNFGARTDLAVWKLVMDILPTAERQGVDMTSAHTAFRQWLDKSPCWMVSETLEKIRNPATTDKELVVTANFFELEGDTGKLSLKQANRPEGWDWTTKRWPCCICGQSILGIFFDYFQYHWSFCDNTIHSNPPVMTCLGCKLVCYLEAERDHYKHRKRAVISRWLQDDEGEWNHYDLNKALKDYYLNGVEWEVTGLEDRRIADMSKHYDAERAEIQRPEPKDWHERSGPRTQSLTVHEKDQLIDEWNWYNGDRRWAHGHP